MGNPKEPRTLESGPEPISPRATAAQSGWLGELAGRFNVPASKPEDCAEPLLDAAGAPSATSSQSPSR